MWIGLQSEVALGLHFKLQPTRSDLVGLRPVARHAAARGRLRVALWHAARDALVRLRLWLALTGRHSRSTGHRSSCGKRETMACLPLRQIPTAKAVGPRGFGTGDNTAREVIEILRRSRRTLRSSWTCEWRGRVRSMSSSWRGGRPNTCAMREASFECHCS